MKEDNRIIFKNSEDDELFDKLEIGKIYRLIAPNYWAEKEPDIGFDVIIMIEKKYRRTMGTSRNRIEARLISGNSHNHHDYFNWHLYDDGSTFEELV